jgi:hypothetical protein
MLGLLLLVLVLWIALGLDRSRRYRLHDRKPDTAVRHQRRAVSHHRHHRHDRTLVLATQRPTGVGRHTPHWLASHSRDKLVSAGRLNYRTA